MSLREILLLPGIQSLITIITTGGKILQEDGVSRVLLEDGSFLTLE